MFFKKIHVLRLFYLYATVQRAVWLKYILGNQDCYVLLFYVLKILNKHPHFFFKWIKKD